MKKGHLSMRGGAPVLFAVFLMASLPVWSQNWPQWGRTPQHTGAVDVVGQHAEKLLDDLVYDPFVGAILSDPDGPGALTLGISTTGCGPISTLGLSWILPHRWNSLSGG